MSGDPDMSICLVAYWSPARLQPRLTMKQSTLQEHIKMSETTEGVDGIELLQKMSAVRLHLFRGCT